nr:hypothetical protein BaRGS_005992 [Batillaria attramentaria]
MAVTSPANGAVPALLDLQGTDCKEARTLGYPTGVYHIQPALASQPFPAYCTTPKYGRTYISKRHSANPLFNRSWHEYRNGFGDPAGNYWIGLENLYLLTNSGLRYSFKMEPRLENKTFYQHYYNNFKLGPESDKYRLHYDSTGTNVKKSAGDCLALSLGAPFSTYDADNDGDVTVNCAQRHQSGWWFPEGDCSLTKCNPHGVLVQSPGALWSGKPEDVFWVNDFGNLLVWNIVTWLHRD